MFPSLWGWGLLGLVDSWFHGLAHLLVDLRSAVLDPNDETEVPGGHFLHIRGDLMQRCRIPSNPTREAQLDWSPVAAGS